MLFVYASPVLMPFIYNIQFALLDNVQISIPRLILSLSDGVFYISKTSVRSQNMGMRSTLTPHQKSNLPKFLSKSPPHHPLPHTTNCCKFTHNSQTHFDNHFEAHPKYPSTNTINKLSDILKISHIYQNIKKSTPNPTIFKSKTHSIHTTIKYLKHPQPHHILTPYLISHSPKSRFGTLSCHRTHIIFIKIKHKNKTRTL